MTDQSNNKGASPSEHYYGNKDNKGMGNTTNAHEKENEEPNLPVQTDRYSGHADQRSNAQKHTGEEGHDDLDKQDMNSLCGRCQARTITFKCTVSRPSAGFYNSLAHHIMEKGRFSVL